MKAKNFRPIILSQLTSTNKEFVHWCVLDYVGDNTEWRFINKMISLKSLIPIYYSKTILQKLINNISKFKYEI